jgi:hypothetical protein
LPNAVEGTAAVVAACVAVAGSAAVACEAAAEADSEAAEVASGAEASRAVDSVAVDSVAADFAEALIAALGSAADSGLPPSMDFTAAMDTTIRSSTILIHLRILIPMDTRMIPMDTHMPGTVQAPQA